MHYFSFRLGVQVHSDDGAVQESRCYADTIWRGADGDTKVLLSEAGLTLISFKLTNLDFTVS